MSTVLKISHEDLNSLHFDQVIERLKSHCMGPLGQAHVLHIKPIIEIDDIHKMLEETASFKVSFEEQEPIPIYNYDSIKVELGHLKISGYVLEVESMQKLVQLFESVYAIQKYFVKGRQVKYQPIYQYIIDLYQPEDWVKAIRKVIDADGEVKANASPELVRLSGAIHSSQLEVDKEFKKSVSGFKGKGYLSDSAESIRNGRRVLSVTAEHKRKIEGIIHDESATGRTAFIEPAAIVQLNNAIVELNISKRKEIYRLLKSLSEMLHPFQEEIRQMYHTIGKLDMIRAKAKMSLTYDGVMPKLVSGVALGVEQGIHPLLYLKNKKEGKTTIPFNLSLHKPNRILLLSGPNAGGKSILMKAVGLMQLMVQSGMLVSVDPKSTFGIYKRMVVEIGDQQSIENELSTYSGRLLKMKQILETADEHTMLLIDEFGSGTDPKLGAAMAEALLRALNYKKVSGVITTHYSNLKAYAFQTKGIVNGAMVFDKEKMVPTYLLNVGRPGSSFTFEIAQNSGLDVDLIKYARKRSGKAHQALEDLLLDLEDQKRKLEVSLDDAIRKERNLDQLIKNYERMSKELDVQKKKFKLKQKEQSFQGVSKVQKEMEKLVKDLKADLTKAKKASPKKVNPKKDEIPAEYLEYVEKAKKSLESVKKEQKVLQHDVIDLADKVTETIREDIDPAELVPGKYARLQNGTTIGQIQSLDKKDAFITFGGLTMRVKLKKLIPTRPPIEVKSSRPIVTEVKKEEKFEPKLDIRGLRPEEANKALQQFMDEALLSNSLRLQIVHGKGTGVLRKLTHKKLREYKVSNYFHPEDKQGGDGLTVVEI